MGKLKDKLLSQDTVPYCPHCGAIGEESNKYLYRCTEVFKCGRYF
jgi:hypothetical protein